MERRRIGSLDVSVVGVGCNNFGTRLDEAATARVVHAALDRGVVLFDTADTYGRGQSETYLGAALRGRRDDAVIATKFGMPMDDARRGAHPDYVRRAVEDSLRRLGTDRIDLYQIHQPDPTVPIADTLGALDDLVRAGKVREIGCSNFSAAQLRAADDVAASRGAARFASVQNQYSLLHREPETGVLAECERTGTGFLPYYPLANGLLTGKYHRGEAPPPGTRLADPKRAGQFTDEKLARMEALRAFAAARGRELLELAFAWLLARPVVSSVIAGATKPEQVAANASAAGWTLGAGDLEAIDAIVAPPG